HLISLPTCVCYLFMQQSHCNHMKYFNRKFFTAFIICLFFSFNLYSQKTYIWCGSLLDIINEKMLNEMTIIVENNKIISVEKGYSITGTNNKVFDLINKTVLPG
ncbi:MAG: hypothetical protein ABI855_18795, partial [Bacteroidota bacterium]